MSKLIHKKTTKAVAEVMLAHYENPMESPWEFLYEMEDEAQYVDDLMFHHHNMYHKDLKTFREDIMMELAKLMKVKIKIA